MHMTKPGTLAGIFVAAAIVGWLATRATFTNLPLLPITAVPALAALALAEAAVGRSVHLRVTGRRKGSKPLAALAVARLVALAKASSTTGAAIGGLVAGYLVFVLREVDKSIPARDARVAGVTLAAALVLVAAALYLEHCCRAPKPPDDSDDDKSQRSKDTWQWHA
jgi:fructose-specific phosphotransferase system IIC component